MITSLNTVSSWLRRSIASLILFTALFTLICSVGTAQSFAEPNRTFIVSLPRGVASLPDIRLLRQGDGLLISVHTAGKALNEIWKLREAIRERGGNPDSYKYIVRTFPADLEPDAAGLGPPFFADVSAAQIGRLQARTFAIMFDHEPVWYRQSPDRLPAWRWEYRWSRGQIQVLAHEVTKRGFRAGALVTGGGERRWTSDFNAPQPEGFAGLLRQQQTDLSYLIVQTQRFCRQDNSGATYGAATSLLAREITRMFGANANLQLQNVALQISLGDSLGQRSNVVPPEWAERCLNAVPSAVIGSPTINTFLLFQWKSRPACEVLLNYRPASGVTCG
jgi:hypothetical protein